MIFSIANLVYELPHELPKELHFCRWGGILPTQEKKRLKILGNKEILGKVSNLGEDIAQHPVPLAEIKPCQ